MQLRLDRALNRLMIDSSLLQGTRRWESLVLATMIQGEHSTAATACGAAALNSTLAAHGQKVPLTRKQWSLLWQSINRMFTLADRQQALAARLQHGPRSATVGPWWWKAQPGDMVEMTGEAALLRNFPLPGLSVDPAPGAVPTCALGCCFVRVTSAKASWMPRWTRCRINKPGNGARLSFKR